MKKTSKKDFFKNMLIILFFILIFFIGFWRFLPYINLDSILPFGYDAGMYREIFFTFKDFGDNLSFSEFPRRFKHEPTRGVFSNMLDIIGISIDIFLKRGMAFFFYLTGLLIALIFQNGEKKHPKKYFSAQILGITFFTLSISYYDAFAMFYFKQIIAIPVLLGIVILRLKKQTKYYLLSVPLIFFLFVLHRTTGLYFVGMYTLYLVFRIIQDRKIPRLLIGVVGIPGIFAIIFYGPLIYTLVLSFIGIATKTGFYQGVFFEKESFLRFQMFFLPLSLLGLIYKIKKKQTDMILSGYLIGVLRTVFELINFRREFINFDIFIILLAVEGILFIYNYKKSLSYFIFGITFFFQSVYYFSFMSENDSRELSELEINSIIHLSQKIPKEAILMTTSSQYTPYIMGYGERDRISPGLSDINRRNLEQWRKRRGSNGKIKCEMLKETYSGMQIYLRIGINQGENIKNGKCFIRYPNEYGQTIYYINIQK